MSTLRFRISCLPKLVVLVAVLCVLSTAPFAFAASVSCSGVAAWSSNSVSYAVGALVTYNGSEYKCLQAHTSEVGWDPVDVPALWSLVGTCSSGGATPTPTAKATATATAKPTATATGKPTATATAKPTATATAKPTATATGGNTGLIFSQYKDITVDANWNTGAQQTTVAGSSEVVTSAMPNSTLTWAFATGTCGSESWAGVTPALEATNVQLFVNAGKKYIVSTGGANGSFDCPSGSAFISFINTYHSANMVGVDFDIEVGQSQAVVDDLINATKAAEAQFPSMRFSFTVATFGGTADPILGSEGDLVVKEIQRLGLGGNYTVNLMAMDYGSPSAYNCVVVSGQCEMGQSANQAAMSLHSQYGLAYSHIELTPMDGANDTAGENFTLSDVDTVSSFAKSNGLAGVHFWSLDRDPGLSYSNRFKSDLGVN